MYHKENHNFVDYVDILIQTKLSEVDCYRKIGVLCPSNFKNQIVSDAYLLFYTEEANKYILKETNTTNQIIKRLKPDYIHPGKKGEYLMKEFLKNY